MFSIIDGETVVMSIENNSYYGIDLVGSRIWKLIKKGTNLKAILEALNNEFDAQPE